MLEFSYEEHIFIECSHYLKVEEGVSAGLSRSKLDPRCRPRTRAGLRANFFLEEAFSINRRY